MDKDLCFCSPEVGWRLPGKELGWEDLGLRDISWEKQWSRMGQCKG